MIKLNGRMVDEVSLVVTGIDRMDYPDFVDAYFAEASYSDGTPLTEDELYELTSQEDGLCQELARRQFMGG